MTPDIEDGENQGAEAGADHGARRQWWTLAAILMVAAAVRLWRLGSLPPGMFRDEAEKALNSWFLLQNGMDASGRPWPVFIEVFGVTTSAIYQYATMPFLAMFGLNEWTARLPAATAGVATVGFTWLLCRRVWGWQTAAWAAGLLAISPWHVPLSRWAQQGVFLPLLFTAASWGVAVALDKFRAAEIVMPDGGSSVADEDLRPGKGMFVGLGIAASCVALAMYAYDPARLFAPMLALGAAIIWWRVWVANWRAVLAAMAVFLVCASPVIWLVATRGDAAQARFRFLSVFQPGVAVGDGLLAFAKNYLAHFSPVFLVLRGDEELRHSAGVGMLNFAEAALAFVGAAFALGGRCRWGIFIVLWVLCAPVAASLTRVGVPHGLRSQVALPAWQVLAALGITGVAARLPLMRAKAAQQIALLAVLIGALPFFFSYFGSYVARSAGNWQYGVKQSLEYLDNPPTRNSTVYFHNIVGAEYLVPFYKKMTRGKYLQMLRGVGRYRIMPFQLPDREAPAPVTGPAAWITPPGYQWPANYFPLPITVPVSEEMPPSTIIYLNPQLMEQVREQSQK